MIKTQSAYVTVYEVLKHEIIDGELPIGSVIPAEPDLEKRFAVSRTTIRRAIDLLTREGFVLPQQGKGTKVLDYKTSQSLNRVTSLSETLSRKGYSVESRDTSIVIKVAPQSIAEDLGINSNELVVCMTRITLADGKPIAIMKNYIPSIMVPGIESNVKSITSLYQHLSDRYKIYIESAIDKISAKNASKDEARLLDTAIGTALIYLRRVCYSKGRPACADRISILGENYEFEINMMGRN